MAVKVDQSMGAETFEIICRTAWEQMPGDILWADVTPQGKAQYAGDLRAAFAAAADLMPIETLHGADGASMWLRGGQ